MKVLYRALLFTVFILILVTIIAYARGYRIDSGNRSIGSTGIIAVNSYPQAASVYLDGQLKGATSLNLTLPPKTYTIEVKKEGYTSVSKTITLKGELVQSVDALLFPINPSLSPLTSLGVVRAIQVDQTDRILLFSENGDTEKDGVYLFETGKRTLSFLPPLTPLVFKKNLPAGISFEKAIMFFSYDYKQGIVRIPVSDTESVSYLLSLEATDQQPFDVTTSYTTLLEAWESEKSLETMKVLEAMPRPLRKIASTSFSLVSVSPDENKILYRAKTDALLPLVLDPPLIASNQSPETRILHNNELYVYDKKEDKNFHLNFEFRALSFPLWYPDSKHFVLGEKAQISVIDYDGTNKQAVYSGPHENEFVSVDSDGKLLILANLNPTTNKLPDLYSVGIR